MKEKFIIEIEELLAKKKFVEAEKKISQYKKIDIETAFFLSGLLEREKGNFKLSEEYFREAIKNNSRNPRYFSELGILFYKLGELETAKFYFNEALFLKPNDIFANLNLGLLYRNLGDFDKAIEFLKKADKHSSDFVIKYNLAYLFCNTKREKECLSYAEEAYKLNPENAEINFLLGSVLQKTREFDKAKELLEKAVAINPNEHRYFVNLGIVCHYLGEMDCAVKMLNKALALKPDDLDILLNLASVYIHTGRYEEAEKIFEELLKKIPEDRLVKYNHALLLLKSGEYRKGFEEYENRLSDEQKSVFPKIPFWKGENLKGKKLLVLDEQGIGDTIQFIRYLSLIRAKDSEIILQTKKSLISLFEKNFIADRIIPNNIDSVEADYKIYLLSLPFITRKFSLEYFNYLKPTGNLQIPFEEDLKPKIGIVWRGNPENIFDRLRSSNLSEFSQIFENPAIFYSFQIDATNEEKTILRNFGVIDFSDKINSFEDTANLLAKMDLVISVDTALVHLAGAMDIPTWAIIGEHDWRWGIETESTFWYNSVRLIRIKKYGEKINSVFPILNELLRNKIKKILDGKILLLKYKGIEELSENEPDKAKILFAKILKIKEDAEAFFYTGYAHYLKKDFPEALEYIEKSVKLNYDTFDVHNILGHIYLQISNFEKSAYHYGKIIEENNNPDIYNNYGFVLYSLKKFKDAEKYFDKAIRITEKEGYYLNAANCFFEQEKYEKALKYYDRAIELNNQFTEAYLGKALLLLKNRKLEQGFVLFRKTLKKKEIPATLGKNWEGESLKGKTILVYTDHGLGDAILFSRFLKKLKEKGAIVNLVCDKALIELFETSPYVDNVAEYWFGFADFHCSILELPSLLKISTEKDCSLPNDLFMLDNALISERKNSLAQNLLNVGLVWETYSKAPTAKQRSIELKEIETLFSIKGINYFILQKDTPTDVEKYLTNKYDNVNFVKINFLELAYFVKSLDLVVSIDSVILNLAGSLNVKSFGLINKFSDWRWGKKEKISCFYPSVELIYQKKYFTWKDEITKIEGILSAEREKKIAKNNKKYFPDTEKEILLIVEDFLGKGATEQAEKFLEQAIAKGEVTENILFKIAYVKQILNKNEDAIFYYQKLLERSPLHSDALNNIAVALRDLRKISEAEKFFKIALRAFPNNVGAANNLGLLYEIKGEFDKAIKFYDKAIKLKSDFKDALLNKANSLMFLHRFDEAINLLDKIIRLEPENVGANYNKSVLLLFKKNYPDGFRYYEWRRKRPEYFKRNFSKPELNTKKIKDKKILVYDEQGYGDTIQFVRFVYYLKRAGAKVILQTHASLVPLFKNCDFADIVIPRLSLNDPEDIDYDYHIPLLSLPYFFGIKSDKELIVKFPYIKTEEKLKEEYKKMFFNSDKIKVGIVWEGKKPVYNEHRSMHLKDLEPFIKSFDFEYYSLQQKEVAKRNAKLMKKMNIVDLSEHLHNFSQTASIIENLDFIVTIDTSIAHLAGALNKKTIVMLSAKSDWRWSVGEKTPWYPSHFLIRQSKLGNWNENVKQLINRINSYETDFKLNN